jgi:acyl-[acyl carrier protein]--UDP-N-acetylglucosamine O-acyltransferase
MSKTWTAARKTFEVPCTIEIEQTSETLHAHVVLDGNVQIGPGDEVMVHDAPTSVEFGERLVVRRTATVVRGSALDRLRARIEGYLELTELYEVSFSDGRAA